MKHTNNTYNKTYNITYVNINFAYHLLIAGQEESTRLY